MTSATKLDAFLAASRERVDALLETTIPPETEPPEHLHRAMRYAVFSGGKRLRPALAFGGAIAAGGNPAPAASVAGAVELVHACSLVLDDLPAMDNKSVRRGHPAVHVVFGETTAILAGHALLASAFEQCARLSDPAVAVAASTCLARGIGSRAIIGGQAEDLALANSEESAAVTVEEITSIHLRKTAVLFRFAVWSGGLAGGLGVEELQRLDAFGQAYGLAFQVADDLRDANPEECSILNAMSADRAHDRARDFMARARSEIEPFGTNGWALEGLAGHLEASLGGKLRGSNRPD